MEHPPPLDLGPVPEQGGWEGRGGQSTPSPFRSILVLGMGRGSFEWDVSLG